jgi:hypothetical protein
MRKSQLMLAAVVALGVGGRMWRSRVAAVALAPDAVAQLDTQLARVDSARGKAESGRSGSRGGRKTARGAGADPKRARDGEGATDDRAGVTPRVESTPIGALDPETAARRLAEIRVEPSPSRADSKRKGIRPTTAIVDLDLADARTIEVLPGIGPSLARRIVEDRAKHGFFGSLAQLERVRGIGPALASQLEGHVTFGGTGRPSVAEISAGETARAPVRRSRQRDRPP